ncbi:MAG: hypothetical protein ACXVHX_35610 [Solirubrobacteraceae bacterium]
MLEPTGRQDRARERGESDVLDSERIARETLTEPAGGDLASSGAPCRARDGWSAVALAGVRFKDGIKVSDDDTTTTDEKVAA